MNTTNSAVLTGTIVTIGRWAGGKKLEPKVFVGMGGMAIGLAALGSVNEKLAESFGVLILVAAAMLYMPAIARSLGYSTVSPAMQGADASRSWGSSQSADRSRSWGTF